MPFSDLIIGALLHDIGKLIVRTMEKPDQTYRDTGAGWLRDKGLPDSITQFAASHYYTSGFKQEQPDDFNMPASELLIVYEADSLSSGERPEKEGPGKPVPDLPLMPVFSKISLDHPHGKEACGNCRHFYSLSAVGEINFPGDRNAAQASYSPGGYRRHWEAFEGDFKKILPDLDINALLLLLEKYTSYIPSETRVVDDNPENHPDVSLFDHLKTTAAIAACLYRYMEETWSNHRRELLKDKILDRQDRRYLLVGGDFSGVQKFIYTTSSKGALKTLRARSFFLELLAEHVISKILVAAELPRTNIVYSGGGRFYLLAPNTRRFIAALDSLSVQINNYLYHAYGGQVYLAIAKVAFPGSAFIPNDKPEQNIAYLWGVLKQLLNEQKNRKFIDQITKDPAAFWSPGEPEQHLCSVCHNGSAVLEPLTKPEDEQDSVEVCPVCKQLFELGGKLANTKYIACLLHKPDGAVSMQIDDTYYAVCAASDELKNLDSHATYVLNSWDIDDYLFNGAVQFFTGNYAARQNGGYKEFDVLAREALGADRIGILRMDVDNLGTVFTRGLPEKERSFSRLSALSRSLTHFFKYHINEICRGRSKHVTSLRLVPRDSDRNVIIVYSGGDDLFLAGAWDDVTELAFDIAGCFAAYTGNNPDLTISGGVVVQDAKYPLYKLAELAGEAEDRAKDNGRNSISLFYSPVPQFTPDGRPLFTGTSKWTEVRNLIENIIEPAVAELSKLHDDGNRLQFKFSKGFIKRMASVADIWLREGKLYLPKLAYILARESELKELKNSAVWPVLKRKLHKMEFISHLHMAVTWMDLLSRRGEQDG